MDKSKVASHGVGVGVGVGVAVGVMWGAEEWSGVHGVEWSGVEWSGWVWVGVGVGAVTGVRAGVCFSL